MQYEYDGNGDIVHRGASVSEDPSVKGKAHGDRAYALAVALMAAQDRQLPNDDPEPHVVPRESPLGLLRREMRVETDVDDWWEEVDENPNLTSFDKLLK